MRAILVIEIKLGVPRWYSVAVNCLFLTVIAALLITPLRISYVLVVLGVALAIVFQDIRSRKGRSRFSSMLIYPDFSVVLIDRNGSEHPVEHINHIWASRTLIVLAVSLSPHSSTHLMIARTSNNPDAFRRCYVISRFGFAVDDSERHNVPQSKASGA